MSTRLASHAGSWYSDDADRLDQQLAGWLKKARIESSEGEICPIDGLRAIIAPHAGYSYSGPTAGYAYTCIDPDQYKRVFILGPSHHYYLPTCALSRCAKYETPLGDLVVDQEVNKALSKTGQFEQMTQSADEDEHSLEMHLPYVYKVFENHQDRITVVPILIGALSEAKEQHYGKLLAPYLEDPQNLFIVSSDFCHWGSRFDYTYYSDDQGAVTTSLSQKGGKKGFSPPDSQRKIYESIQALDHEGMQQISLKDHAGFARYLAQTKNTICGRHPIGVLLAGLKVLDEGTGGGDVAESGSGQQKRMHHRIQFVRYAQSSQ
ncbi:hypothetical protein BGW38_006009, partial [Lunasporangiospora selenospora]